MWTLSVSLKIPILSQRSDDRFWSQRAVVKKDTRKSWLRTLVFTVSIIHT